MKKKILVTGADGFIGSHLTEELVRRGYDVKAFVQYNSFGSWGWLDHCSPTLKGSFEVILGDVRDTRGVSRGMKDCTSVFHLAALIAIPYSYNAPESYVDVNVKGTLNVLQAAREQGVDEFIHTSTSEVYGSALFVPIDESHPLQAQSPYAATKIAADKLVQSFYHSFALPAIIVRPFNTYGPRQSARAVIPSIITQLLGGAKQIKLGSLEPTRDFNFVKDTVNGFICALETKNVSGNIVNIGSGFEVSIGQTLDVLSRIIGVEVDVLLDTERVRPDGSEVDRLLACNTLASDILGWNPEYSGLDGFARGLEETVEWFRSPENLASYKIDRYNV